jgi:ubiquitin carboxyl-terminal hydrolase 25/28
MDQPAQQDKMMEALRMITEDRNSARLRTFVETGRDGWYRAVLLKETTAHASLLDGDLGAVIKPEWPRGLNQLGNTCYLNSLLQVSPAYLATKSWTLTFFYQYFYTIKDLREAIAAGKFAEDTDQLSEDDIKRHPIGGRLVTKKEIERSKKCKSFASFHSGAGD